MRLAVLLATLTITVATTATVHAQPGMTTSYDYAPAPQPAPAPTKSESTALLWSIGVTAAGVATFVSAAEEDNEGLGWIGAGLILVGPSAGHIYAGETGHALKTSLLRTGGVLVFMAGVVDGAFGKPVACSHSGGCLADDDNSRADMLMLVGGATFVATTLYDLYDAPRAARRRNARDAARWSVAPAPLASNGSIAPGVAFSGSF